MRGVVLLGLMLGVAHAAPKKLAVLELVDHAKVGDAAGRYLTDRVRGAAAELDRGQWFVLTRENILDVLPPGTDLAACEGDCEVETGRNVGADQVISGDIARLGSELRVTLRLHETAKGTLLGQETASAARPEALDGPVSEAAQRLLGRLRSTAAQGSGRLVITGPPGMTVLVDGIEMGKTPKVTVNRLVAGAHRLQTESPCLQPVTLEIEVRDGQQQTVALSPDPRLGVLKVRAVDASGAPVPASVFVDGARLGITPGTFEPPVCAKNIEVKTDTDAWRSELFLARVGETAITAVLSKTQPVAQGPSAPRKRARSKPKSAGLSTPTWMMIFGAGGIAVGVVSALKNQEHGSALQNDPGNQSLRDEVDDSYKASIGWYIGGGALFGLGLANWIAMKVAEDDDDDEARVHIGVGPNQVGVGGTF